MSRRHDNQAERDVILRRAKRLQVAARMCAGGREASPSQSIDRGAIIGLIGELDHLICDLAREMAVIDCEIRRLSNQARAISAYSKRNAPRAQCNKRIGQQ